MLTVEWATAPGACGWYGGDYTHALAAWASTERSLTPEREARLPQFLARLATSDPPHDQPFEKSYLGFLVRCDVATHIHLLKHRIGVLVNAESARYKLLKAPEFHTPADWPISGWGEELRDLLRDHGIRSGRLYELAYEVMVKAGWPQRRARETARYFLPYALMTTIDASFNFRSFVHFLGLRRHHDAQEEVHVVADLMLDLVRSSGAFKHSLAAFGYE